MTETRAPYHIQRIATPESAILAAVVDLILYQYRGLIIRINSGAARPERKDGKKDYVKFYWWQCLGDEKSESGVSDVLALLPPPPGAVVSFPGAVGKWPAQVTLWGLPLYIECKSPDRRRGGLPAAPSPDQARFLAAVAERGGLGLVVDEVGQLISELERLGY